MTAVLPARPSAAERRAAPSLAAAVRDLDRRRARSRQRMIGASELGECRRRAAYRVARRRPTNTRTGLQAFMGTELHRGVLRALRRQYGGLTEVGLKGEQVRGRCDWWHTPVVEDLKTTSRFGFERAVPRGGFGPGVDTMCDWCPFLDLCWGPPVDPETEGDVSRQSRLTVTDEDYVEAVHDYDAWRAAENEAKRHKEYARERLRGRSGAAGDLYCEWSGGGLRTQVDKDAAVERLAELGEAVPTRRVRSPQAVRVTRNGTRPD